MTEHSQAITISHPPAVVLRAVNPIVGLLLRTPLLGGARKELMVVSFNGRKTGRRFSIPLSAHHIDNALYAISGAPWKHNFRGGASAEVLHDGTTVTMRGELIEDRAAVAELCRRTTELHGVKAAQRMLGMKFRDPQIPSLEEFTEAARQYGLTAIRFTPTA